MQRGHWESQPYLHIHGCYFSPYPSHQSSVISSLFDKPAYFPNYWEVLLLDLEKAILKDFPAFEGHSSEGQKSPACRHVPTEKANYMWIMWFSCCYMNKKLVCMLQHCWNRKQASVTPYNQTNGFINYSWARYGSTKSCLHISLPCTRTLGPHEHKLSYKLSQEGVGSWRTLSPTEVPRGSASLGLHGAQILQDRS